MSTKKSAPRKRRASAPRAPTKEELLAEIGEELRGIANMLKRVESYVIVARMALQGQNAEQDYEVVTLLQRGAGDLLSQQLFATWRLAKRCDGLPIDELYEDEDEGDDE